MNVEKQVQNILDSQKRIRFHKTTILVGENGCGKSVVRKMMGRDISKLTNDKKAKVRSVSMEKRTAATDGLGMFFRDAEWEPTSIHTQNMIWNLVDIIKEDSGSETYLIIDEPEIGMSKESQLAFINFIKEKIPFINFNCYGMLIITHSDFIVSNLKDLCDFINLSQLEMTVNEWLNREIIPTDFKTLEVETNELYRALLPSKEK